MKKGKHWIALSIALILVLGINSKNVGGKLEASDEHFEFTYEEEGEMRFDGEEENTELEEVETPDEDSEDEPNPDDHFEFEYEETPERYDKEEVKRNLVINYVDQNGNALLPSLVQEYKVNTAYEVSVPTVDGYSLLDASQNVLSGLMTLDGLEFTVTYVKNEEPVVEEEPVEQPTEEEVPVIAPAPVEQPKEETVVQKTIDILTMPISELMKPESERVVENKTPQSAGEPTKYTQINLMTIIVVGILVLMFVLL